MQLQIIDNEVLAQYQHICMQRYRVYVFDMIHGHGKIMSGSREQRYRNATANAL